MYGVFFLSSVRSVELGTDAANEKEEKEREKERERENAGLCDLEVAVPFLFFSAD